MAALAEPHATIMKRLDSEADALVDLLSTLIRIPSLGGSQAECDIQQLLADWLRQNGFEVDHWQLPLEELTARPDFPGMEVSRDRAFGVVGRVPGRGGGASLLFNGHVDVVPPGDLSQWRHSSPFIPKVSGDLLYGRGACDMKAGLVAALFAARALREVPLRGDLLVACVAGEEDGGLGSYGLLHRGWTADACVIPEPTGLDLVPANAGALTFRLHVTGRATHASRRSAGVSAVERFWPVFDALRQLERRRNEAVDGLMRRWDIAYPIEIGTVAAGDWASSVPDALTAEGRLGVALDEPVESARSALEEAVAEACRADDWLREHPVTVEWWGGQFASGRLGDDSLPARVQRAHQAVTGGTAEVWGAPYGSDLRLLSGIGGIPTLQYGPGDSAVAHAANESVSIADTLTAAKTLALVAMEHCGVDT